MIEDLIPFIEHTAVAMNEDAVLSYGRFSRKMSDIISEKRAAHIAEHLLRSKVQAEADLSTRM